MAEVVKGSSAAAVLDGLHAEDIRVPQEQKTLRIGIGATAVLALITLGLAWALAARISGVLGWIVFGLLAAWVVLPHSWLWWRARARQTYWLAYGEAQVLATAAEHRLPPQRIVHEIARLLRLNPEPLVVVATGRPFILTIAGRIILTDDFYQKTTDRDLQALLLHEIGHLFAGHPRWQAYAQAVPSMETEGWLRMLLWPALPWLLALEEWEQWADITADRLILLFKPEVNLAILAVIKQFVLTSPDSDSRNNLVRFLGKADDGIDRGEELMVSTQINALFHNTPQVEQRVSSLRTWEASEAYTHAAQRLRQRLAHMGAQSE